MFHQTIDPSRLPFLNAARVNPTEFISYWAERAIKTATTCGHEYFDRFIRVELQNDRWPFHAIGSELSLIAFEPTGGVGSGKQQYEGDTPHFDAEIPIEIAIEALNTHHGEDNVHPELVELLYIYHAECSYVIQPRLAALLESWDCKNEGRQLLARTIAHFYPWRVDFYNFHVTNHHGITEQIVAGTLHAMAKQRQRLGLSELAGTANRKVWQLNVAWIQEDVKSGDRARRQLIMRRQLKDVELMFRNDTNRALSSYDPEVVKSRVMKQWNSNIAWIQEHWGYTTLSGAHAAA